ncbi:hypothetical protein HQ563_04570 [bacterium]|nr:hypothetical protein [bacterium]
MSPIAQNEEGAGSWMKPGYTRLGRDHDNAGAGNGMDDDWETAYFGNTDQPPDGDFDEDGTSNLDEFLSQTDPSDAESVLAIISWHLRADGFAHLSWNAVRSQLCEVQYRDLLEAEGDWLAFTRVDATCSGTVSIVVPIEDLDRRSSAPCCS